MPNEPSLWDLQRLIERNHADAREDILDLKAQMASAAQANDERFRLYLLREVFEAREGSMLLRIGALEKSAETAKTQIRGALMASAGSVIAGILIAIVLSVVLGGKP
ncbi:hypothetical protein [Actinomadura sp. SCN-SB]|uniref:hypothetical protein n=1 Tax=Actinomadura sp. SCN-SB TaxID=3373092 RepID=UPI0037526CFE